MSPAEKGALFPGNDSKNTLPPGGFPFRTPRTLLNGTASQITEQQKAERRMAEEKFGPIKIIERELRKHDLFMDRLEEFQFKRALGHMEDKTSSIEDAQYVFKLAHKYLTQLSDSDFQARLGLIREGRYSNADVVLVSNHLFLTGEFDGSRTIARFFMDERQPQNLPLQPSTTPDIVDIANGLELQ